jgi:homoserine O-acetyltransferase/O-succinyltransferase
MSLRFTRKFGFLTVVAAAILMMASANPAFGQTAQELQAEQSAEEAARLAALPCKAGPVSLPTRLQGAPWTETLKQGDYTVRDFHFKSGETLPELKLHYYTLGAPERDASGKVTNAIMIGHGTGGTGRQFLSANFAGVLFGPGQLLDAKHYFIILPDGLGHGCSSKPSNGLHAKFPHYDYDDMVAAQHAVIADGLKVNHLLLVMGTSMGCMHAWVWGETYPDFMDGLVPLACQTVPIAGRNRVTRKAVMDAITSDPEYKGGEYTTQLHGMIEAEDILLLMGSAPLYWQKSYPTRDQADAFLEKRRKSGVEHTDPNDMLYYFNASRNYNPDPDLEKIKAKVLYINSADDTINPPELGIAEQEIKRVKNGKFVLLPITDQTRGHGTHSLPAIWQPYLWELLHSLGR